MSYPFGHASHIRVMGGDCDRLVEELKARRGAFGAIAGDWDPDDVRRFAELMRRFNEGVEAQRSQPWPRGGIGYQSE